MNTFKVMKAVVIKICKVKGPGTPTLALAERSSGLSKDG